MASLTITVKPKTNRSRRIVVEMDADKFERLAASFGFFNPGFLKSLSKAEVDYRNGKVKNYLP